MRRLQKEEVGSDRRSPIDSPSNNMAKRKRRPSLEKRTMTQHVFDFRFLLLLVLILGSTTAWDTLPRSVCHTRYSSQFPRQSRFHSTSPQNRQHQTLFVKPSNQNGHNEEENIAHPISSSRRIRESGRESFIAPFLKELFNAACIAGLVIFAPLSMQAHAADDTSSSTTSVSYTHLTLPTKA